MELIKIHIKNMVCDRCIRAVRQVLENEGLQVEEVQLGEAIAVKPYENWEVSSIQSALSKEGFELLDDRKSKWMEQVKNIVIDHIHHSENVKVRLNWSEEFSTRIGVDYHYLSSLFSSTQGVTIEQYIIAQRIEKAKELLIYNELTLSQISYKLGYSSVQHLSTQFRKVTGMTPSAFKQLTIQNRKALDKISE